MLTNSQEELLLQEYVFDRNEMKELGNHLELEPFNSFSNLDLVNQGTFMAFEGDTQDTSLSSVDDKITLQQHIVGQQYLQQMQQHQQQQQQQQQQINQQYINVPAIPQPLQRPAPIQCKEEFAGDYNFQLILNNENSGKHWVYSQKLQKVFIHMEEVLPIQFSWTPPQDGLWVRATMVYKLDQHRSQPVIRCHNHMALDNSSNRNINPLQVKHVIRCTHSASTYEEIRDGHLSVLTPLGTPEAGVTTVPMDYRFYCKNSCASGMNRRATELIFTLETQQNQILGRRKLELRVCSCPKRDKEKEEGETGRSLDLGMPLAPGSKKRKMQPSAPPPPPGKKMLLDSKVYHLDLKVVGKENYNAIMKFAYDCMAGSAYRTNNPDLYKPYMDDLLKKM